MRGVLIIEETWSVSGFRINTYLNFVKDKALLFESFPQPGQIFLYDVLDLLVLHVNMGLDGFIVCHQFHFQVAELLGMQPDGNAALLWG